MTVVISRRSSTKTTFIVKTAVSLGAILLLMSLVTSFVPSSFAKVRPYSKTRIVQNGLRLSIVERSERPLISFHILVRAGSKYDPDGKSGLASVTAQMLRQGAGSRKAEEFQRLIDSIGVRLRIEVTRDAVEISATCLRKELLSCTRLLRDMLMEQRFEEASFARQIQRSVSAALQAKDAGHATLSDFAFQQFFSDVAYGNSPLGDVEQLSSITLEDVKAFYQRFYAPDRISIVAAGAVSAKDYVTEISQTFSPYHKNKHPEKDISAKLNARRTDSLELFLLDTPGASGAKIGFFALCDSAKDTRAFGAELMLSHLLAGFPELSFLGRKLGSEDLVSNLRAEMPFSADQTLMEIQMDCTSDRVVDAVKETLSTLRVLRESRISKREIEEGKKFYRGFYALGFETAHDVTERFAELMRADLSFKGHDTLLTELNDLTQADLRMTSERIFAPSHLIVVIRGDASQYAEDLRDFGAVRVVSAREANGKSR